MNTTNPNCFVYEAGELLIELLGGVRVDTLDGMRVTMKVIRLRRTNREDPRNTMGASKDYLNNEELAGLSVRRNPDFSDLFTAFI
jgi:hypothetical protein